MSSRPPITREQWTAMSKMARRLAWARWDDETRDAMRGQFTATTPGDGLRYPNDYNAPADSPAALRDLANDTQAALNKRMNIAVTKVNISRASGWANNFPTASKSGKFVVLSGHFQRSATLTASANTWYQVGTLPAGYRPQVVERVAVTFVDAGIKKVGVVQVAGDGSIEWTPQQDVTLNIDDLVQVSSITFVTA